MSNKPMIKQTGECMVCLQKTGGPDFCEHCHPTQCPACNSKQLSCTRNNEWVCDCGASMSPSEMAMQQINNVLSLPASERLSYAEQLTEVIIRHGTDFTLHYSNPCEAELGDGNIVCTHYTRNVDEIKETGLTFPPHDDAPSQNNKTMRFDETVRHNALYAWPFSVEYMESDAFTLYSARDTPVFIEVDPSDVVISAFNFVDWLECTPSTNNFDVATSEYDEKLTFTVETLINTTQRFERPVCFTALHRSIKALHGD